MTGAIAWVPNNTESKGIKIKGLPPPANMLKNRATKLVPEISKAMTVVDKSRESGDMLSNQIRISDYSNSLTIL